MAAKKKQQKRIKKEKVKMLCPECYGKLKLNSHRDGYKTCYYCGLVLYKPPFATADNTIIPDIKIVKKKNK